MSSQGYSRWLVLWLAFALAGGAILGFGIGRGTAAAGETIVREVVREVPKEVVKIREVEKKVEVPFILEDQPWEKDAKVFYKKYLKAKDEPSVAELRGIKAVYVLVSMKDETGRLNETLRSEMETKLKLELRRLGIRVVRDGEVVPERYVLSITILPLWDDKGYTCSYSAEMQLACEAFGERNGEVVRLYALPYARNYVGVAGSRVVRDEVSGAAQKLTDQFLNSYLEANPR